MVGENANELRKRRIKAFEDASDYDSEYSLLEDSLEPGLDEHSDKKEADTENTENSTDKASSDLNDDSTSVSPKTKEDSASSDKNGDLKDASSSTQSPAVAKNSKGEKQEQREKKRAHRKKIEALERFIFFFCGILLGLGFAFALTWRTSVDAHMEAARYLIVQLSDPDYVRSLLDSLSEAGFLNQTASLLSNITGPLLINLTAPLIPDITDGLFSLNISNLLPPPPPALNFTDFSSPLLDTL
ncbi:hypothetical protein HK102_002770, partial [Quaeritorhiza haematococci]